MLDRKAAKEEALGTLECLPIKSPERVPWAALLSALDELDAAHKRIAELEAELTRWKHAYEDKEIK